MLRDVAQLSGRTFDLLVVGGGIYGLTIACDAAQRGLSVALIERNDFGSGASFNHLRTIHGGLRYLQTLDLPRARESVRERRTLARIAPDAVRPLPFVLPLGRSVAKGPLALRAGFLLDRLVSRDRNDGLPASHRLPAGQVLSRDTALRRFPALAGTELVAAAVWHDYVTVAADRLTLSWALAAADHGAVLANYVEASQIIARGGRATGVAARDLVGGAALEIAAGVIVNATGAAVDRLLGPLGLATGVPMLKAMNLVTTRAAGAAAIGGRGKSGRNLFMVPWQRRELYGTWESPTACAADDLAVHETEVASFIDELNHAYPRLGLTRAEVALVHRGVVPAVARHGAVRLEGHEQVHDHAARGVDGLISVAGTKYTTARASAERIVDRAFRKLKRTPAPSRSATTPLPWRIEQGDALLLRAAREEMVVTLTDAVVRRTPLGAVGYPGDAAAAHAAGIVGRALGWDERRIQDELAALRRFYGT